MQIHILKDGETSGPFAEEEVRARLAQGTLLPSHLAWHDELVEWQPLDTIISLKIPPPLPLSSKGAPPLPPLPCSLQSTGEDVSRGNKSMNIRDQLAKEMAAAKAETNSREEEKRLSKDLTKKNFAPLAAAVKQLQRELRHEKALRSKVVEIKIWDERSVTVDFGVSYRSTVTATGADRFSAEESHGEEAADGDMYWSDDRTFDLNSLTEAIAYLVKRSAFFINHYNTSPGYGG